MPYLESLGGITWHLWDLSGNCLCIQGSPSSNNSNWKLESQDILCFYNHGTWLPLFAQLTVGWDGHKSNGQMWLLSVHCLLLWGLWLWWWEKPTWENLVSRDKSVVWLRARKLWSLCYEAGWQVAAWSFWDLQCHKAVSCFTWVYYCSKLTLAWSSWKWTK